MWFVQHNLDIILFILIINIVEIYVSFSKFYHFFSFELYINTNIDTNNINYCCKIVSQIYTSELAQCFSTAKKFSIVCTYLLCVTLIT